MPWSTGIFTRSNGVYSGSMVWTSDKNASIKIRSDRHDTHDQDLAQGINNCLAKDGSNYATGNLNLNGNRISNLGGAALSTEALSASSIYGGNTHFLGVLVGTTTITGSLFIPLPAYSDGQRFLAKMGAVTNGANPTLNINSVGAVNVKLPNGSNLQAGMIPANAYFSLLYINSTFVVDRILTGGQSWTPTYGGTSSLTYTSVTTQNSWYSIERDICHFALSAQGTTGGTTHLAITFTLPFTAAATPFVLGSGYCFMNPGQHMCYVEQLSTTVAQIYIYDLRTWNLASGVQIRVEGKFKLA